MSDILKRSTNWILAIGVVVGFATDWLTQLATFLSAHFGDTKVAGWATTILAVSGWLARNRDKWLSPLLKMLSSDAAPRDSKPTS